MDPRVISHPDPTNDVIPDDAFDSMDSPLIQNYLSRVTPAKLEVMRRQLALADAATRRSMIFLHKQQGMDETEGNLLESVTCDQTEFGICGIMGMPSKQEDSVSCAVMPGFKQLSQPEQDAVAKATFANMQAELGRYWKQAGSTMTVASAWKTRTEGGYRINTHTAYVGNSPAFIVVIDKDGNVTCRKLNRSPNLNKAIGDVDAEINGLTHEPTIEHYELDVAEEDKVFVVSGSHGMTEDLNDDTALEEAEIRDVVNAHRNKPVHEIAKELAKRGVMQGNKDNISCAVFEVTENCASLNVNDGHGGRKVAKLLSRDCYPDMQKNIRIELEYKNKIIELLNQISAAATLYVDLGRETHIADFRKLIRKLNDLDRDRGDRSNLETYREMVNEVNSSFNQAEKKYRLKHPAKRSPNAFAEAINENADEYHYPRTLALALQHQQIPKQEPQPTWVEVKEISTFYDEITNPKDLGYPQPPSQSPVLFCRLIDDMLNADFNLTKSDIDNIEKLIGQANPKTHIGLAALLNNRLKNNEPLGIHSSLIPQAINFARLTHFVNSLQQVILPLPAYLKSGGKKIVFGGDDALPAIIWLLHLNYHDRLPLLDQKINKLKEIYPDTGSEAYILQSFQIAITALNNMKSESDLGVLDSYIAQVDAMTIDSAIEGLPRINFAIESMKADKEEQREALAQIFRGEKSEAEIELQESLETYKAVRSSTIEIINLVKTARDEYGKLGRSTHTKDFDTLIATLTRIATDNKDLKESRMYAVIEAAYQKEQKPPMSISRLFRSDAENAEKFKEKINKNQTIFHYPRMLAVIMQQPALKQARETEEVRMNAAYNKVRPTLRTAYKKIAPITTDYRDLQMKLNENLQKILNIQDISKLAIRTREIDNAVNYGTTILPEKRINQIAEILEKQTRFPSILIADMLNVMIEQMRDPWKTYTQEDVAAIVRRSCGADGKVDATLTFWGEMVEEKDIQRISKHLFDIIAPLKLIVTDDVSLPLLKGPNQAMRPAL